MERSRRQVGLRILKIAGMTVGGVALAVLFAFVFGIVVKALWNWLMPGIFGLPAITYWQAFGLVILAKLLFGIGGGHRRPHDPGPQRRFDRYTGPRWVHRAFEQHMRRRNASGDASEETADGAPESDTPESSLPEPTGP